jgi:L-cystine uptake protein TcyP (sodium:dicarboxylate symporter family)
MGKLKVKAIKQLNFVLFFLQNHEKNVNVKKIFFYLILSIFCGVLLKVLQNSNKQKRKNS